jgi:hypothetical protein
VITHIRESWRFKLMYTVQEKPDQHATRFQFSVLIWSQTIRISRGPRIATFYETPTDLDGSHCSWEKLLLTQSTTHRLTDPWVHTQFLFQADPSNSRLKPSFCRQSATRLAGPISPTCDWYVQYLLTGANPLILNRHRRELQPLRCRLTTTTPDLSNQRSPIST